MKKDTKNLYKEKIVPSLMEEYGYKNVQLVPKLLKISINRGLGEEARSSKEIAKILLTHLRRLTHIVLEVELQFYNVMGATGAVLRKP